LGKALRSGLHEQRTRGNERFRELRKEGSWYNVGELVCYSSFGNKKGGKVIDVFLLEGMKATFRDLDVSSNKGSGFAWGG